MATRKNLTREIIYRYGSIKKCCEATGMNENTLRTLPNQLGAKSKPVEDILKELGLHKFLEMDRTEMAKEYLPEQASEAANV